MLIEDAEPIRPVLKFTITPGERVFSNAVIVGGAESLVASAALILVTELPNDRIRSPDAEPLTTSSSSGTACTCNAKSAVDWAETETLCVDDAKPMLRAVTLCVPVGTLMIRY